MTASLPDLIAEVSKQLARIEKKGTAPQMMGGFAFVRETDVIDALKPELDSRGIVLRPDVELLRLDTFPRSGKDMPNTVATILLALYAVRGAEEYLISRTVGQGADTQDKAVGKAVTAAKKQAILIAFAIPTGDDPDGSAIPERARRNYSGQGAQAKPVLPAESSETPAPAPAPASQDGKPSDAVIRLRYAWARDHGWTDDALEAAAIEATAMTPMEMGSVDWQLFAAAVVKAGPAVQTQLPIEPEASAAVPPASDESDGGAPPVADPVPKPKRPRTTEEAIADAKAKAKVTA